MLRWWFPSWCLYRTRVSNKIKSLHFLSVVFKVYLEVIVCCLNAYYFTVTLFAALVLSSVSDRVALYFNILIVLGNESKNFVILSSEGNGFLKMTARFKVLWKETGDLTDTPIVLALWAASLLSFLYNTG